MVALIALWLVGCSHVPDYVIKPEKMAQLLADIHIGESVVEINHSKFETDSMKKVVKQSILLKHGVTQQQVDTSFVWYGHHIEEYVKVYDRVIDILEEEIDKAGSSDVAKTTQGISLEGDSVDIWQGLPQIVFTSKSPSQFLTFTYINDRNWEKGDTYRWRVKLVDVATPMNWCIVADYADGTTEYKTSSINSQGWNDISIMTDSEKKASRIYGYICADPKEGESIYLDSISLVRTRFDERFPRTHAGQICFAYGKKEETAKDGE